MIHACIINMYNTPPKVQSVSNQNLQGSHVFDFWTRITFMVSYSTIRIGLLLSSFFS